MTKHNTSPGQLDQVHAASAPAGGRPWRLATLAGMASYLDAAALITTGAALVMYKHRLGVSAADIGALSGLLTFMFAAGALFGGRLGDIYGRRRIFTGSLVLYLAGAAVLASAVNISMLVVGIIAMGVAIGADLPVSLALINEESPEEDRGQMVSYTSVLWAAGIVGAEAVVIVVGHSGSIGARIAYLHLVIVAFVVLVLRARTPESRQWSAARTAVASSDTRSETSGGGRHSESHSQSVDFSRLRDLFRRPVSSAVLATGLYLATWNVAANTLGAFGAFMWVELAGQPIETQAVWGAIALPFCAAGLVIFMRVVDTARRTRWFVVGCAMAAASWLFPLVLGPTALALVLVTLFFQVSASFSGEIIYKVWSQESVPVLLRSTGQGLTLAFARVIAALAALGTPSLALAHPRLLFALLFGCCLVAALIGLFWAQRLPHAEVGPLHNDRDQVMLDEPLLPTEDQNATVPGGSRQRRPATSAGRNLIAPPIPDLTASVLGVTATESTS